MTAKFYKVYKNKVFRNNKGIIAKFVSKKNIFFKKFGEVYLNYIRKNKKKGWILHKKNKCLFICGVGKVEFHLINSRGLEKKITLNECSGKILEIPKKTWFSFQAKNKDSLTLNLIERPHNDREVIKKNKIKNYSI